MKSVSFKTLGFGIASILVVITSCKKNTIENPYDTYTTPRLYEEPTLAGLPSSNFGYLHATVFKPTCANSGCHDGAFEPDFRTISSSYNSTVYQNVLTNNPAGDFTYRIKPGDAALSLLHERMLQSLPNTSGIMPPVYADEWIVNKSKHIKAIKDWINAGAKDMYGNSPVVGNPNPVVTGFSAFHNNSTTSTYARPAGAGILPIIIPRTDIDLWFSIDDDMTSATNMTVNEIKIDTAMFEFDSVPGIPMTVSSGFMSNDFSGSMANFTHKYDFDASIYPPGTLLFVRVYVQDANHNEPAENPSNGSSRPTIYLFTLYTS